MPIVAAVDQSERAELAVEQGRELADAFGVELHVVHVGEFSVGNLSTETNQNSVDVDDARQRAEEIAADVGERAENTGEFKAVGLVGDAADELLEYSTERNAEYIVISGRKKSPVGKAVFGSLTQSVLLSAAQPVVSVMADAE